METAFIAQAASARPQVKLASKCSNFKILCTYKDDSNTGGNVFLVRKFNIKAYEICA